MFLCIIFLTGSRVKTGPGSRPAHDWNRGEHDQLLLNSEDGGPGRGGEGQSPERERCDEEGRSTTIGQVDWRGHNISRTGAAPRRQSPQNSDTNKDISLHERVQNLEFQMAEVELRSLLGCADPNAQTLSQKYPRIARWLQGDHRKNAAAGAARSSSVPVRRSGSPSAPLQRSERVTGVPYVAEMIAGVAVEELLVAPASLESSKAPARSKSENLARLREVLRRPLQRAFKAIEDRSALALKDEERGRSLNAEAGGERRRPLFWKLEPQGWYNLEGELDPLTAPPTTLGASNPRPDDVATLAAKFLNGGCHPEGGAQMYPRASGAPLGRARSPRNVAPPCIYKAFFARPTRCFSPADVLVAFPRCGHDPTRSLRSNCESQPQCHQGQLLYFLDGDVLDGGERVDVFFGRMPRDGLWLDSEGFLDVVLVLLGNAGNTCRWINQKLEELRPSSSSASSSPQRRLRPFEENGRRTRTGVAARASSSGVRNAGDASNSPPRKDTAGSGVKTFADRVVELKSIIRRSAIEDL